MRSKFARPERTLRSELLSLLAVALVPLGIMSVFPYRAAMHKFKLSEKEPQAFASLVFLSDEQEAETIQRARSAWQTSSVTVKGLEIDLAMESLPELGSTTIMDAPVIHAHSRSYASSLAQVPLSLPSLAAEMPERFEAAPIVSEKYFKDEDLMKLK